jgi:hypothetical protein
MPDRDPSIELPAPTQWPMIAALGITLGFAGLVTHVLVSVVGVVMVVVGAVGWWREVLPVEHVERIPLRPPAARAKPVQPAPHKVAHLSAGEARHRVRVPEEIHPYSAGVTGGLAGGAAMAVMAVLYGLLAFGSPWYAVNLLAAAAMPSMAAADTATLSGFHVIAFAVALISHAVVSMFVGLVYAAVLPMFPRHPAIWGGWIAPLIWSGLLWASLDLINPALNARIAWPWFVASQIAFGLVAGFVIARSERIATMQTWPLAARAGIEAPGLETEREGDE